MTSAEPIQVDLSACCDKASLMQAFATALQLPSHFGHNWDALWDVLREAPTRRVQVSGWSALRRAAPAEAAALDALREDLADAGMPVLIDLERGSS